MPSDTQGARTIPPPSNPHLHHFIMPTSFQTVNGFGPIQPTVSGNGAFLRTNGLLRLNLQMRRLIIMFHVYVVLLFDDTA
jgi:hypothetical protein